MVTDYTVTESCNFALTLTEVLHTLWYFIPAAAAAAAVAVVAAAAAAAAADAAGWLSVWHGAQGIAWQTPWPQKCLLDRL